MKRHINRRLKGSAVAAAISPDSRASDCLQMADLVAGAVRYAGFTDGGARETPKHSLVRRPTARFDLGSFITPIPTSRLSDPDANLRAPAAAVAVGAALVLAGLTPAAVA